MQIQEIQDGIPETETEVADIVADVAASAALVVHEAERFVVDDDASFEAAGKFLVERIKAVRAELADTFGPMTKKAHDAHKEILAQRKRHEQPLIKAEGIIKASMGSYHREQKIVRERAAQEQLETARREAEDAAVDEAARLERQGDVDAAEDRLRQPVIAVVAAPAPAVPQAAGVSVRTLVKFRVVNEIAVDRSYLKLDEAKIGKVVRAMGKDAERLVGGIEVYEEESVAAGSR